MASPFSKTTDIETITTTKYNCIMKKNYFKPEARFVDINLIDSVLEGGEPIPQSGGLSNEVHVWDENADGKLPTGKSVWGEQPEEE
jgi:hypothetical protein